MLEIIPIPAFTDNYFWLLKHDRHAVVVDPGDAGPVISTLENLSLTLDSILITHHHSDHIGGVDKLLQCYPAKVYAPKYGQYHFPHLAVEENNVIHLDTIKLDLIIMEVPGHTLDHIAYYGANYLFCGDTLFGAGCGRLFEGTAEQMYHSLQRLAKLPKDTAVYCAHEYTEKNLGFACMLETGNQALSSRQQETAAARLAGKPSLPATIKQELETNPFLRCHIPSIQRASGIKSVDPIAVFSAIREMRNHY